MKFGHGIQKVKKRYHTRPPRWRHLPPESMNHWKYIPLRSIPTYGCPNGRLLTEWQFPMPFRFGMEASVSVMYTVCYGSVGKAAEKSRTCAPEVRDLWATTFGLVGHNLRTSRPEVRDCRIVSPVPSVPCPCQRLRELPLLMSPSYGEAAVSPHVSFTYLSNH